MAKRLKFIENGALKEHATKMSKNLQGASARMVTGYIKPQSKNVAFTEQQIEDYCKRLRAENDRLRQIVERVARIRLTHHGGATGLVGASFIETAKQALKTETTPAGEIVDSAASSEV